MQVKAALDPRVYGREAIYGAAYLMTDRAWVSLAAAPGGTITVTLTPKDRAYKTLKQDFQYELKAQVLRWQVARNSRDVRAYVAANALPLAEEYAKRSLKQCSSTPFTDAQLAEIDRLIQEVTAEPAR